MEFVVEVNGAVTGFCLTPGQLVNTTKKQIEFDQVYDKIRFLKYYECVKLKANDFEIITPNKYTVILERVENLSAEYDKKYNFSQGQLWLENGNCEFRLNNVKIRIDEYEMKITVQVSSDATVKLDTTTVL